MSAKRVTQAVADVKVLADPERATHSQKFFRTGPGQYGAGDQFLGIRVPQIREVAARYRDLDLGEVEQLLGSPFHEVRLLALVILVDQFKECDPAKQKAIYDLYMHDRRWVNNWDLVDLSAPTIVGGWLKTRSREKLYQLARSSTIWDRRISVLATFQFIRDDEFTDSLAIAEILLQDKEDLIQKAVGWMLREIGKRNRSVEEKYLKEHCKKMPRTMLRYAIEKFPDSLRKRYLQGRILN
ncbi:MAG: DNA alkylation repair protein [Acidiferrobacterales bacterium]|nr:DNA alkylation repair protein [Acidiferrobacterales bacterium]